MITRGKISLDPGEIGVFAVKSFAVLVFAFIGSLVSAAPLVGNPGLVLKTGMEQTATSVRIGVLVLNKGIETNVVAMLESTDCLNMDFRPTVSKVKIGPEQYGRAIFTIPGVAQKGCKFKGYIHSEGNPRAINTFEVSVE